MSTFAYTDQIGRDGMGDMMTELSSWSRPQAPQVRHAAAAPSDDAWVTVRPAGQRTWGHLNTATPARPTEVAPRGRHAQPVRYTERVGYAESVRSAQATSDSRPARPAFVW